MKSLLLLLGIIFLTQFKSLAQYHPVFEGVIVTTDSDTIFGKFRICDDWYGCQLKGFKDTNGTKINVKKIGVISYQYKDYFFEKMKLPSGKSAFLRVIKNDGQILYEHNYSQTYNNQTTEYQDYYLDKGGVLVKVKKSNYEVLRLLKH